MTRITVVRPEGGNYIYDAGDALDRNESVTFSETDYTMIGELGCRVVYRGVFDVDAFGTFVGGTATQVDIYDRDGALNATIDQIAYGSDKFVGQTSSLGLFIGLGATSFFGNSERDYFYGSSQNDTMYGGDGNDYMQSNSGADQMFGEGGRDFLDVRENGDFADGGDDEDTVNVFGVGANLVIRLDTQQPQEIAPGLTVTLRNVENVNSGSGADDITGSRFANTLNGGTGNDTLRGGAGDDTYNLYDVTEINLGGGFVFKVYDTVQEAADAGNDTVIVRADKGRNTYTLTANVENLFATNGFGDTDGYNLFGNSADNLIRGYRAADTLTGGGGSDTMEGDDGDDVYYVDDAGDRIIERFSGGVDSVYSSVSFSLKDIYVENVTLTGDAAINAAGNALGNLLAGNGAANVLFGGGGRDLMRGGAGSDTYYVDHIGDKVEEANVVGADTVYSSVSYSIGGQFVENLILTGSAAISATGNSLGNLLTGNGAANILNGGGGRDLMRGGAGADVYFVDNAGDKVEEANVAGVDTVNASVSYSIGGQFIENLTLTGAAAIDATGNSLGNVLTGNNAANILIGGAGRDLMRGGVGNDTYGVDNVGDRIVEANVAGIDGVAATVSYSLGGQFIENLTLKGSLAINATGNSLANVLTGNGASNVLTGGAGADTFVFNTRLNATSNVDDIADFKVVDDTIRLDDAFFPGLARGALAAGAFRTDTIARDADDRIIHNRTTGELFFDVNGDGAGGRLLFATLDPGLFLTHADFVVV